MEEVLENRFIVLLGLLILIISFFSFHKEIGLVDLTGKVAKELKIEEKYKISRSGDILEINEAMGDVVDSLTDRELKSLSGGIVTSSEGTTRFNQYLRFKGTNINSGKIVFDEDERGNVGDFLYFKESDQIFEYQLEFENGFESDIDNNKLGDLEDEKLRILNNIYFVSNARLNGNKVELDLIGGTAQILMEEGEVANYKIGNNEFMIYVENIDDVNKKILLKVNEQEYQFLKGDIEIVNGIIFGLNNIFFSEAGENTDKIALMIGAEKIRFEDNYNDDSFSETLRVNGRRISHGFVKIKASKDNNKLKIFDIRYRLKANSKDGGSIFLKEGENLKDNLEDPEALIGGFDIMYNGLETKGASLINLNPSGDRYTLIFTNKKGQSYNVPFVANVNSNLKIGDSEHSLHFIEGSSSTNYIVKNNDYFVLSNRNDRTGTTNILRYDSIDTANKIVNFDELNEGNKNVVYSGTEGSNAEGTLVVNGNSYKFYVGGAPNYNISIDLNNDGDVSSDEVNIVVDGGGVLDLGSTINPNNDFSMTLKTESALFDEASSDETITINIQKDGTKVNLDVPTQSSLSIETESNKKLAMSNYGVKFEQRDKNPDVLEIEYPREQAYGDVDVVVYSTVLSKVEPIETEEEVEEPLEPEIEEPKTIVKQEEAIEEPKETEQMQPIIERKSVFRKIIAFLLSIFK